jgi:folate-binding protein YgfZ
VAALEAAVGAPVGDMPPYHTLLGKAGGHPVRIVNRPLGELSSFDLLVSHQAAPPVWHYLLASGITPVGLEAFEAARVGQAVPAYGQEMGDPYNPLETGLIGSIDFAKGCYIGQEVIARLDTYQKVKKHLVKLRFSADAVVSDGASLCLNGQTAGSVTSVTRIPTTGGLIGLGYVQTRSAATGTRLELVEPADGWAEIQSLPQLFGPGQE